MLSMRGSDVERETLRALMKLIAESRGTCATFTCKKIARLAGLDERPVTLSIVKYVLEKLREQGLIEVWSSGRKTRYIVTRNSPLWRLAKTGEMPVLVTS